LADRIFEVEEAVLHMTGWVGARTRVAVSWTSRIVAGKGGPGSETIGTGPKRYRDGMIAWTRAPPGTERRATAADLPEATAIAGQPNQTSWTIR
jgi:hypothetical protein